MAKGARNGETREVVLLTIGVVITVVWSIAVLVQVADPSHVVPTQVHVIMGTVALFFFGGAVHQARKNIRESEDDEQ